MFEKVFLFLVAYKSEETEKVKYLNEAEIRVLNEFMDDTENMESVSRMIEAGYNLEVGNEFLIEIIIKLLKERYLECYKEKYFEKEQKYFLDIINDFNKDDFKEYWFKITDKGRQEVNKKIYNRYWDKANKGK